MKRHIALRISLLLLLLCARVSAAAAESADLKGRVFEAGGNGVSGLTLKLIAPKKDQEPERVTVTNEDGRFVFHGVGKKHYLLEAYQGITIVYRDVVDVRKTQDHQVELAKKTR